MTKYVIAITAGIYSYMEVDGRVNLGWIRRTVFFPPSFLTQRVHNHGRPYTSL